MNPSNTPPDTASRRGFLKTSVIAGAAATLSVESSAWAAGSDELKIGIIGTGGRASGAANQALTNPKGGVRVVAMGDALKEKLDSSLSNLLGSHGDKVDVPENRQFVGLDCYKGVLESDANYIILGTPPGFRPYHFEAAINAGKHVFMEKPVAVDAPGIRKVHEMALIADQKGLKVACGLQRRYQNCYREAWKMVKDGLIGEITGGHVYWNGTTPWFRERKPEMSELSYQLYNWYYYTWLCGDHINEQHVHNLDIANWFMSIFVPPRQGAPGPVDKAAFPFQIHDATPIEAQGMGGRMQRNEAKHGQIYDHHAVEYTYANGVRISSQCRHMNNTYAQVREEFSGTKGILYLDDKGGCHARDYKGTEIWRYKPAPMPVTAETEEKAAKSAGKKRNRGVGGDPDPYVVEHMELQQAIRENQYRNNAYYTADSTMMAILGRMATYTGKKITWDEAYNSKALLMPAIMTNESEPPVKPDAQGRYPIAIPGWTAKDYADHGLVEPDVI
jgi:myo-inositol 2-dehydrogenase / D-chiro-inositol 1-dehydrogenase